MSGATFDRALRVLCLLWVGGMAGFFWAFSVVVMPGLAETDPLAALAAMQGINRAVDNPLFFAGFFGAPLFCLLLIARALVRRGERAAWVAAVGGVVYLVGVFGVTVGFNVPLNDDLAPLDPTRPENGAAMTNFLADWRVWNDVRTLTGVVAFVLVVASLVVGRARAVAVALAEVEADGPAA